MNTIRAAFWARAFDLCDYLSERAWKRYCYAMLTHGEEMACQKAWRRWHDRAHKVRLRLVASKARRPI